MTDAERLEAALAVIPSEDRTVWLQVGNALKTSLGEDGYVVWEQWSRGAENFDSHRIRADWNSLRAGMVTLGTVFHLAKQHGWTGEPGTLAARPPRPSKPDPPKVTPPEIVDEMKDAIAGASIQSGHPYLVAKGFPDFPVLVHTGPDLKRKRSLLVRHGDMILPMIRGRRGDVTSVQTIDADGGKRFWPGTVTGGGYFRFGRGPERYVCEGFATGLSVRDALSVLGRRFSIFVAFSATGVRTVARRGCRIVADHDLNRCKAHPKDHPGFPMVHAEFSRAAPVYVVPNCPTCGGPSIKGAGQRYAAQTRCRFWIPEEPGDANDFHQAEGLYALVHELRVLV